MFIESSPIAARNPQAGLLACIGRYALLIAAMTASHIAAAQTVLPGKPCNAADQTSACARGRSIPNPPSMVVNPAINDVEHDAVGAAVSVIWTPSNWAETRIKIQYGSNKDALNKETAFQEGVASGKRQQNTIALPDIEVGDKVYYRVVLDWYAVEDFVPKVVSKTASFTRAGDLPGFFKFEIRSNENNATLTFVCLRSGPSDRPLVVTYDAVITGDGMTKPYTIKYDNDPKLPLVGIFQNSHEVGLFAMLATIDTMYRKKTSVIEVKTVTALKEKETIKSTFDLTKMHDTKQKVRNICKLAVI